MANHRSIPVFSPVTADAELTHPLGRMTRLRIHLEGCRGLRCSRVLFESPDTQQSYFTSFAATSSGGDALRQVCSSRAQEGEGSLRGTVQWNEVLDLECFERGLILIGVHSLSDDNVVYSACLQVAHLLAKSELILWTLSSPSDDASCTLCLSASRMSGGHDERTYGVCMDSNIDEELHIGSLVAESTSLGSATSSLGTILCQVPSFVEAVHPSKVLSDVLSQTARNCGLIIGFQMHALINNDTYWIQKDIYSAYEHILNMQSYHARVDILVAAMVATMDAILPISSTYVRHGRYYVSHILDQLFWSAVIMNDLVSRGESECIDMNPEAELARLTMIIVTPIPIPRSYGTSARSNQDTFPGTIAKDVLLLALDAIVQSSDAFPPLKSAASGLLFFATCADMASGNKRQVRDIYGRIDGLAASLKRGAQDGDPLSLAHQDAIAALAHDIAVINEDLESIINGRKNRFKRYFSAKRHLAQLQDVVWQLDNARANYTTAIATLNATTNARVLAHVQALTLVMGVQPVTALGTRRADAATFPLRTSHIAQV